MTLRKAQAEGVRMGFAAFGSQEYQALEGGDQLRPRVRLSPEAGSGPDE